MTTTIEATRTEVQHAFERALGLADSADRKRFWDFERELWSAMLELGRALVMLFLSRQAGRPRPAEYSHDGRRFSLNRERRSAFGTRFGKVEFTRKVGSPLDDESTAADLPIDRELGLCSGFSLGVAMALTRLCAQLAFAPARNTFRYFCEWTPSTRATLRIVDAVGAQARPFLEQLPPPKGDGDFLVAQVDGRGAPMISEREYQRRRKQRLKRRRGTKRAHRRVRRKSAQRPRRKKGEKSKNAKVAIVGVLYTLRRTPDGREGPINKRICATFESHEALFIWLQREAIKRGYGIKPFLFLADGSDHIWRLQQKYLPLALTCLDWIHAIEKVWNTGECFYSEGSAALRNWVATQAKRLREGNLREVIHELADALRRIPKTGPGNKNRRKRLAKTINHFFEHRHRMQYDLLRAQDLDIGTGAVEGAVRNLVAMRLDGPGMRWGRGRAEHVLHLRCVLINGLWEEFEAHVAASGQLKLRGAPIPARPHQAKPQQVREAA